MGALKVLPKFQKTLNTTSSRQIHHQHNRLRRHIHHNDHNCSQLMGNIKLLKFTIVGAVIFTILSFNAPVVTAQFVDDYENEETEFVHSKKLDPVAAPVSTASTGISTTSTLTSSSSSSSQVDDKSTATELKLSPWNFNATYASTAKYNPRGMAPFYKITNDVLGWFIGEKAIPEDYIVVSERKIDLGPKVKNHEWGDLIKHYWGILLVILLVALLVVMMPIIGLCFCCCRCAGACGGRSQPFDKKHDTCRRVFLGFLLICTTTGILFGVVVAFVTNSYMQEGIDEATTTARHGSDDTVKFLQVTSTQIDHLLVKNYKELSTELDTLIRDESNLVISELEDHFNAISLTYLTEFVIKLPQIKANLERMKSITNELRVNASQLSDGLRGVKRDLLIALTKCKTQDCKDVLEQYEIGKLDANGIDYNQLPDVSEIIDSVSDLVNRDISSSISEGKKALENMRSRLNDTIDRSLDKLGASMDKAGQAIKSISREITTTFNRIGSMISNHTEKGTNIADYYIERYSVYRFYAGIGISSILLLVLVCLTISLFCGICGKRPEGYGDDCCNKGSGARFLMLAVAIIFLTTSVLAIAALSYFLVGLLLHRGVCVPLDNPETDQVFQYLDNYIDLNTILYQNNKRSISKQPKVKEIAGGGSMPPFRISHVIVACHRNQSIYEVLRLHNYVDIKEVLDYPEEYKIEDALQSLIKGMEVNSDITIITPAAERKINDLAKSELRNFDKDKFVDNLNETITKFNLRDIATKLRETAGKIQSPEMSDIRVTLRNQALHLETYQDNLVGPMANQSRELLDMAKQLEKDLRYNNKPFEESVYLLLKEIKTAQDFINTKRIEFVNVSSKAIIQRFKDVIMKYLNHVVNAVQMEVGVCTPLSNVYKSVYVGSCNKIIDPFNGFWAGVTWCILLFLPTLVISVKLSSLYQKSESYPGPLVESEYLYDAYSERDNIPLANGPKNKRRKVKARGRSHDRRGDYYDDSGSAHGASAVRDTRYSDMAPRHWDGGPPRYQNPPMAPPASEYERPPPYYYAGAPAEHE